MRPMPRLRLEADIEKSRDGRALLAVLMGPKAIAGPVKTTFAQPSRSSARSIRFNENNGTMTLCALPYRPLLEGEITSLRLRIEGIVLWTRSS